MSAFLIFGAACTSDDVPSPPDARAELCSTVRRAMRSDVNAFLASLREFRSRIAVLADEIDEDGDDAFARQVRAAMSLPPPGKATIFLDPDVTRRGRRELENALATLGGLDGYRYVSSQQALREFKETFAEQPTVYEHLDEDSLPASYRVELGTVSPERFDQALVGVAAVNEIKTGGELAHRYRILRRLALACGISPPPRF